jgi:hypothetical protein
MDQPVRALKIIVVASTSMLVVLLGAMFVAGFTLDRPEVLWLALPLVVGVGDLVLVQSVGATVRPLPATADPQTTHRMAVAVLRSLVFLRLGLADAPALVGLVATFATGSLVPLAIGVAFSVPMLLLFVYPSASVVDGVRKRLEAAGTPSGLA